MASPTAKTHAHCAWQYSKLQQQQHGKSVVVVLLLLVTAARVNEFFYVRCPPHILPSTPLLCCCDHCARFHLVPGTWENSKSGKNQESNF